MKNVEVVGFVIGNVSSAGNTHDMPFTISTRECAASCLDKVGGGETLLWAHWKCFASVLPVFLLPTWMTQKLMGVEMKKRVGSERKSE